MPSLSPPLTSTDASIIATKPYQNNSYPQNQLSNPRPWALQRFSPSSRWRLSLLHSVSDQTFMAEKLSDDSILSVNPKPSKCFSSKLIDLLELLVVKLMHDASLPLRYLSGNFAPLRDETPPVKDLPVHGFLPHSFFTYLYFHTPERLRGRAWEPVPCLIMIHGVRIKDGKATYVSRFVKTSRLQQEEFFGDAKLMKIGDLKGFFGLVMVIMQQLRIKLKVLDDSYGNGTVEAIIFSFHFVDVIKVLEDGDLQTLGMTEYDKRLTHSFTAHPKVDPVTGKSSIFPEKHDIVFLLTHDVPYLFTGEMFTFGCSPMPPYLTDRVISKDGIMHDPVPITISKPIMMHDFAITENYAIFMDLPMHFRPKVLINFKANAWEEEDEVVLITCRLENPNLDMVSGNVEEILESFSNELYEMRFNMKTGSASQKKLSASSNYFPRINEWYTGKKSCVNVIDAKTMSSEPVAVVELPHRVPYGFHALFVTEEQLQEQTLI
ncbi:hypothetical protein HID58_082905 [Brassica napus]|uniref:Uncharacterized protein n=1 Tax=Brassica napus TaxID=3708 RepID=A0ABQ7YD91_BRANA|nr:hypothetical protein HID58_082905 [Brassica napus]